MVENTYVNVHIGMHNENISDPTWKWQMSAPVS